MKTIPSILTSAVMALTLIGCNKTASNETATKDTDYPLDTCVVSGEKLGSMGDPVIIQHEGQEVRFCCDNCIPTFKKDPAKYLSKLDKPGS